MNVLEYQLRLRRFILFYFQPTRGQWQKVFYITCGLYNSGCIQYALHNFFYKNKLYKNTQAEICPKFKNKLRTITWLKFWSEKFKKFI